MTKKRSPASRAPRFTVSTERFVRRNPVSVVISLSALIVAVGLIFGAVTPVTDPLIGRPPFASQDMLEEVRVAAAKDTGIANGIAQQALDKSIIISEVLLNIQLDRAQNQLATARDRAQREPANRDVQAEVIRAESALRQMEERIKRYEQTQK